MAVAAAVLAVAAIALSACGSNRTVPGDTVTVTRTAGGNPAANGNPSASASSGSTAPSATKPKPKPKPKTVVHVSSLLSDGMTYGVGMPIVLYFRPMPTSSEAFTNAVKVTVNGAAAPGKWYWEQPLASEKSDHVVEAHYRMQNPWPAHSLVHVKIPIQGLSAGPGKVFSGALNSLTFHIGAAHISTVNAISKNMTITSDGKTVKTIKVSLGAAATPTYNGTKVVMQKGEDLPGTNHLRPDGAVRMVGPGYDEIVDWSVRVTQSGEYVHAAPWNTHLGQLNTSNGCTNLSVANGKWFYQFSRVGDIVRYEGTDGTAMPSWDGLGDWNLPWAEWSSGGLLRNH